MRLGLDFGGTKIEGVVLGPDGAERARARVATPRHDYDGCIRAIHELMLDLEARAEGRIEQVGIGVPGAVHRDTGTVSGGNSTWLSDRPLRDDLRAALGRPVKIANDANCFALSEATDGAGAGADVVFGAILGSGVGGGIVVHGRLVEGANAIAGEWGHIHLPRPSDDERPGPVCSCGEPGHTEAWLSGRSLAADYARRTGGDPDAPPAAQEVVTRAEGGEPAAEETLRRFEDRLGRALAVIVNVLDPDVIVLGGGLSNVPRFYQTVPPRIAAHVFGGRCATRLLRNLHGDSSGVRGAAWL
jgi:fructokinase